MTIAENMSVLSAITSNVFFGNRVPPPTSCAEPEVGSSWETGASSPSAGSTSSCSTDTALCHELPEPLKRSFDDLDALESGEAREFIPRKHLQPPKRWWQCRLVREEKVRFSLTLERKGDAPDTFLLSARRIGDDFYISRYESFASEGPVDREPEGRYCAVLRRLPNSRHEFELRPMASSSDRLAFVSHSWFKQPQCGAEIRTVEAVIPEPVDKTVAHDLYVWDHYRHQQSPSTDENARPQQAWSSTASKAASAPSKRVSIPRKPQRHLQPKRSVSSHEGSPGDRVAGSSGADRGEIHIANQIPQWNPAHQCLVMKFQRNRIRASSSKNFILFRSQDLGDGYEVGKPEDAIMQFGKICKGQYALDFISPVSPIQAFALALSSFAFKV